MDLRSSQWCVRQVRIYDMFHSCVITGRDRVILIEFACARPAGSGSRIFDILFVNCLLVRIAA